MTAAVERALLDAAYAAPDDDAPRLVYGDWLQDRGDPRGELIALQLRPDADHLPEAERARERDLLASHQRAWLDGLDDPIVEAPRYRRGFVDELVLRDADQALEPLLACPAWATVRTIELRTQHQGQLARLVATPAMRSLRSLIYIQIDSYAEINALPTALGLEHLAFPSSTGWRDPDPAMPVGLALTSVTSIASTGPLRWLPDSALLPQLRRVQTSLERGDAPWLASVLARGDALERVEVTSGKLTISMVAGARRLSRLEVRARFGVWSDQISRDLVPLVAALPSTAFTELVVVGLPDTALDVALEPLRAHQRELTTVTVEAPA